MSTRTPKNTKLRQFVKKNYRTFANFADAINTYFKSEVFPFSNGGRLVISKWANCDCHPTRVKWKWDLLVKYCKKVHNVNVDYTWLEPQPETETKQPKVEQLQITTDDINESFVDLPASERVYQTREAATALIRRAYNIYELSKADAGFASNCCRLSDGYWPSVTIFHDSLGKCGSKVIDLNGESDLLRVSDLLDKLAEGASTETDEELINRVFDGIDPKDMERVAAILQRKGGRDE